MSLLTPEQQSRLVTYRAKSVANTITLDELKEAVVMMRGSRRASIDLAQSAKPSKSKSKPTDQSIDSMLDALEGL